ncbi:protein rolling stone-like [Gigantopelta aegis]|uniref:protein rolling stone-like n=1 Tax=Gigantopelta aegis TaxID=1735272 RepID=UPI001B88D9DA|nr:protein rolling stone-like [Gigantopelta aegis]
MKNRTESTENLGICSREACRKHFTPDTLLLEYDKPIHFVQSQFECGRNYYIVWRVSWAIYHVACVIGTGILMKNNDGGTDARWFIYLTNWSYTMLTLDTLLQFIAIIYVNKRREDIIYDACSQMPWFLKAIWCIYNVSNCSALVVTLLYWSLLQDVSFGNIVVHLLNGVYVVVNMPLTAIPVRIYHFYQLMIFGTAYVMFSYVYETAGGIGYNDEKYIYPQMAWKYPEIAITYSVLGVFVAIPVCHAFFFLMYWTRVTVYERNLQRTVAVIDSETAAAIKRSDKSITTTRTESC